MLKWLTRYGPGVVVACVMATLLGACGAGQTTPLVVVSPSAIRVAHSSKKARGLVAPSTSASSGILAPSATVSVTNPSDTPACAAANLAIHMVSKLAGAGTHIRVYAFRNQGSSSCTLIGYPSLELLNAQGQVLTTDQVQVIDQQNLVTLEPKGQAWFVVQYPDDQGVKASACPASAELQVVPPHLGTALLVKGSAGHIRAFGGTAQTPACGQLDVQPVTPAGTSLSP